MSEQPELGPEDDAETTDFMKLAAGASQVRRVYISYRDVGFEPREALELTKHVMKMLNDRNTTLAVAESQLKAFEASAARVAKDAADQFFGRVVDMNTPDISGGGKPNFTGILGLVNPDDDPGTINL